MKNFLLRIRDTFRRCIEFFRDVRKELNNVSWPSKSEWTGTTVVVIVAVFFFGFFLFVIDAIVRFGMDYVFRRVSH